MPFSQICRRKLKSLHVDRRSHVSSAWPYLYSSKFRTLIECRTPLDGEEFLRGYDENVN